MKHFVSSTQIFPARLLEMGNKELKRVSDGELSGAYDEMRNERDASGCFPNTRRLFGTALEQEKDRREVRARAEACDAEMHRWYERARKESCIWWLDNHLVAKHAVKTCIACGVCTARCPAAQFFPEYNPRAVVDAALSRSEELVVALLKSDTLWYCGQCASCKPMCPRENNIMGLVSSLRFLAQLKGYHMESVRGRQQYAMRHVCGGNLWNRGLTLYFRNVDAEHHRDFGPRWAKYQSNIDEQMARLGASPDKAGDFGGRKLSPQTVSDMRSCLAVGGTLALWNQIEEWAQQDAKKRGISIDEYLDRVSREG